MEIPLEKSAQTQSRAVSQSRSGQSSRKRAAGPGFKWFVFKPGWAVDFVPGCFWLVNLFCWNRSKKKKTRPEQSQHYLNLATWPKLYFLNVTNRPGLWVWRGTTTLPSFFRIDSLSSNAANTPKSAFFCDLSMIFLWSSLRFMFYHFHSEGFKHTNEDECMCCSRLKR